MDPRNGEILAHGDHTPRMDPNEYWKYGEMFPNPTPYNRAVGQTYEPGSVFKVLTMASALDAGAVQPRYAVPRYRRNQCGRHPDLQLGPRRLGSAGYDRLHAALA